MPSSRLKQSSTTRRPIGIDGLRAASVRSLTGFAPRHIFSARHDCDLGADIRCGASQSEAISREHRQAITQVESAHWGCMSCSGAPGDRIESKSKRQRWRPVGTDSLPRSRTPSLAELPLGMENLKREQFPSAHPIYLHPQGAVFWLEVGSASHTFSEPFTCEPFLARRFARQR